MKCLFRKVVIIAFILSLHFVCNGCNTLHGLGRDIEATGEAIQEAATD